jgi:intein/homing endonuclease
MTANIPDITDERALELFGAMIGDGCLSKYYASYGKRWMHVTLLTGNAIKEMEYQLYLSGLLSELFDVNCKPRIRKNSSNTIILETSARRVFDWFLRHGFPCGKKKEIQIPDRIMRLPRKKLNLVIRGIFDTDGQISARKDEKYRYPYIFISSSSSLLRQQIKQILRIQGIKTYISRDNVVVRGVGNFYRWIELVGSRNRRNLRRINEFIETGRLASVGS